MFRRLEDRIRELCAKTVAAQEGELEPAISELKVALHDHSERLRQLAVQKLVARKDGTSIERRSRTRGRN